MTGWLALLAVAALLWAAGRHLWKVNMVVPAGYRIATMVLANHTPGRVQLFAPDGTEVPLPYSSIYIYGYAKAARVATRTAWAHRRYQGPQGGGAS